MRLTLKDKTFLSYNIAIDRKALDIVILDIEEYSFIADVFVICSGTSFRQVQAIADAIEEGMRDKGIRCHHIEGYKSGKWILMDYNDLIIHIFHKDTRMFYDIERLWGDAPNIIFSPDESHVYKEATNYNEN